MTNQEVIVKRIINHIKSDKKIECISDNPEFDPYTIQAREILEIWKVRMKITSYLDQPAGLNANTISEQLSAQHKMLETLQQHLSKVSAV